MQITKKKFVVLAIVFVVGFAGGMLAEHVIHLVQDKKSGHGEHEHMQ